jgi:hypothetical protein
MPDRQQKTLSDILSALCVVVLLAVTGCGVTAKPSAPPSANLVNSYFGGPFNTVGSGGLSKSVSTFDHSADQIGVSALIATQSAQVPTAVLDGTFVTAPTGFLKITENFATTNSGIMSPQNPPLTGAWAVEIPGAGVLANLLSVNNNASGASIHAAPAAMAENTICPGSPQQGPFLYVTVPNASILKDTADYGVVNISTQGSAVTLNAQPSLIGPLAQAASVVTGGCSDTYFGALTAYPLNSFGLSSNLELISIGASGLLVSSFSSGGSGSSAGAFGGGTGVIGVALPSTPVDVSAISGAQYNGFIFAPSNNVPETYDITVLASAFGHHGATSPACSTLQTSLMANNGQGAGTVPVLPSANALYGGEFLTTTSAGPANDPTGASGSENCDVVIDLGIQDSANNGLFPNATVFIGSTYPPFSASNPWLCFGTTSTCAVSFPAAAVVGKVQGQYVIFVAASAASTPAARLPTNFGGLLVQPLGIYLFQKTP